ncbi:glycosyltransferase [Sphingobacterium thalpophilum]|uniref:glycosyltransferase n=1 Tax=Sphingobacterium thalpophilum TaxID=259 RepID=UPI003C70EBA0
MKLLFVHDHPFYRDANRVVYTGGSFPYSLWDNYLQNFDEIIVFGRLSTSVRSKNSITSGNPMVQFYLTENYRSVVTLLRNMGKLRKELRSLIAEADVVLTRLPSVLGFVAGVEAKRLDKPVWVEQVGNAREALGTHGSLLGVLAAPIFEFENKKAVKRANYVTYVTENKLQKDYPANQATCTVSLSDVIIKHILNYDELDMKRFNGEFLHLGVIGSFEARYKGQDILLRAINLLDNEIKSRIKISFVGKGECKWVLQIAKQLDLLDNIVFTGALEPGAEINAYLKSLSLYIQPSLTEGMPRATIEAMAMGCPVIGSNAGGIPDVVSNVFVHKKGDFKQLSTHIRQLFNDRSTLMKEAELSLEKAKPYAIENLHKKRRDFYNEMNKREKL